MSAQTGNSKYQTAIVCKDLQCIFRKAETTQFSLKQSMPLKHQWKLRDGLGEEKKRESSSQDSPSYF